MSLRFPDRSTPGSITGTWQPESAAAAAAPAPAASRPRRVIPGSGTAAKASGSLPRDFDFARPQELDLLQDPRWGPDGDDARRQVAGHDRVRSDHAAVAHRDAAG